MSESKKSSNFFGTYSRHKKGRMRSHHFPVAVAGSGPAGASFAISFLMNGAKNVALIDKALFPRDKACGDGIGPGAV
jgi:threonine dehydrogenase-like Zn-dependent dehydrogenase